MHLKNYFLFLTLIGFTLLGSYGQWQDRDYYLFLKFKEHENTSEQAILIACNDLRFCKFPSLQYERNDFVSLKKMVVSLDDALKIIVTEDQALSVFCISDHNEPALCGIEVPHLARIQCAYVFTGLPDATLIKAYLVQATDVFHLVEPTHSLEEILESIDIDLAKIENDLPPPVGQVHNPVWRWLSKAKDVILSKIVMLFLTILQKF